MIMNQNQQYLTVIDTIRSQVRNQHIGIDYVFAQLRNLRGNGYLKIEQPLNKSYDAEVSPGVIWKDMTVNALVDTSAEQILVDMDSLRFPLTPKDVSFEIYGKQAVSKFLNDTLPSWLSEYEFEDEKGITLATPGDLLKPDFIRFKLYGGKLEIGQTKSETVEFNSGHLEEICERLNLQAEHKVL